MTDVRSLEVVLPSVALHCAIDKRIRKSETNKIQASVMRNAKSRAPRRTKYAMATRTRSRSLIIYEDKRRTDERPSLRIQNVESASAFFSVSSTTKR